MPKPMRTQIDDVAENIRRARAVARLSQVASEDCAEHAREISLAMCVIEELLCAAETQIELLN